MTGNRESIKELLKHMDKFGLAKEFRKVTDPNIEQILLNLFKDVEDINLLDFYFFVSKESGESFYYVGTAPKDEISFLRYYYFL